MLLRKVQKSQQNMLRYGNEWEGCKLNKTSSGLLVCRLIMSLVERLSFVSSWISFGHFRTSLCNNQTSWEMKILNPPLNFACR